MTWIVDEAVDWMDASVGCLPGRIGRLFRRLYWGLRLGSLGAGASIGREFSASGAGRIKIGGGFCSTGRGFLAAEGGSIRMGDHVALNQNVHINASIGGSIDIGNHVMIGPNCVLRASDHRSDRLDMPMQRQGHAGGTIVIEDDVWLGANVVVVAGVRIGRGSVVAAGAVVTKDVEPESVVGGVPARLIRMRGRETAV